MPDYFISSERAENDLLACAAFLAERIKSGDGHADAMNSIVPRYLSRGDVDLAAELANAVGDPFSRDKLLILVAEKCAQGDDNEYALQLADAIEDHGMQAQALERIALVNAGKGNAEKAFEVAGAMAHPDYVYAGVAVAQASAGEEAAEATLRRIEFPAARSSALQQIAAEQIENKDQEQAVKRLDQAAAAAREIEHDEEKIRAFCDIGTLYIDSERNDKAIATFQRARGFAEALDNTHRDFFLVNCALGFLAAGSGDLADRTLDLVTDKTQMASALLGFAREYWKKGEKDDALEALEEAYAILKSQREAETRDSRARNSLFATIGVQLAGFGKAERGIEVALESHDPEEQMEALSQIAQVLTAQKQDDMARQTINSISDDAGRVSALIAVSDSKAAQGETAAALALLDEAATLAETVPQLSSRSIVLNNLASRFAGQGQMEKARAVSMENLEVISRIRDESTRSTALASLSDVFTEAGTEMGESEKQVLHSMVQRLEW